MANRTLIGAKLSEAQKELDLFTSFNLDPVITPTSYPQANRKLRDGLKSTHYRAQDEALRKLLHFHFCTDEENIVRKAFLTIDRNLNITPDRSKFVSLLAQNFLACAHGASPSPEIDQLLAEISTSEAKRSTKTAGLPLLEVPAKVSHAFRVYAGNEGVATLSNRQAGVNVLIVYKRGRLLLCLRPLPQSWLARFFHRAR
jgi:hypothetical protein